MTRPTAMAPDASTSPVGHTPGPWHFVAKPSDDPTCPEFQILQGAGYIATVDSSRVENSINARLIAAAPELLAVAQMVVEASEMAGFSAPLGEAARSALAKARGEVA